MYSTNLACNEARAEMSLFLFDLWRFGGFKDLVEFLVVLTSLDLDGGKVLVGIHIGVCSRMEEQRGTWLHTKSVFVSITNFSCSHTLCLLQLLKVT